MYTISQIDRKGMLHLVVLSAVVRNIFACTSRVATRVLPVISFATFLNAAPYFHEMDPYKL